MQRFCCSVQSSVVKQITEDQTNKLSQNTSNQLATNTM